MMRTNRLARLTLFLAVAGALTFAQPALSQDVLGQARALMEKRDAKGAYELLKPLEAQRAGDADYDYLLGLAAIDAGKPTEGVFALERVLAVNPNHPQARAEIARAYFVLGENETAKREFEAVRKQAGTPTEVGATIQKFLDAIDQVRASQGRQISGYMELTLGHDTNVNAGTSNGQVAIPAFGGAVFNLAANNLKQQDQFATVSGGISVRYPFSPTVAFLGGADISQRWMVERTQFEQGSMGLNAGFEFLDG